MKKIVIDKWYVGLIIFPVITNYLTSYFPLPDIFSDWKITAIITLLILVFILLLELYYSKRSTPSENDKKVITELLDTIDIKMFQFEICEQDGANGYRKDAIKNLYLFLEKVKLVNYRVRDEKINKLLKEFSQILEKFLWLSAMNLYNDSEHFYVPDKYGYEHNIEKLKKAAPKMNNLTDKAFKKLERLMEILRKRNFL